MRIDGAGGCFDNRIYEINNKKRLESVIAYSQ